MQSFFWEYRLPAALPFATLDYTVTDSASDGPPRLHWHHYYELGLCTAGGGTFYFENKCYAYRAGDIFLVNNLEKHGATAAPHTDTQFRFFLFLPGLILDGANERDAEYLLPFRYDSARFCNCIASRSDAGRVLRPLLDSLWDDAQSVTRPGRERLLHARLRLVLAELCSLLCLDAAGANTGCLTDYLRLRPALIYLDANFTQRLSQKEVAAQSFLSESRFRHLFRQELHMSFQEYVAKLRYLEARRLIASTGKSIGTAVREAGFSNPYYFYKMFEQTEGMTPLAYREALYSARQEKEQ